MPYNSNSPFYDALEGEPEGQRANYFSRLANMPFKSPNQKDWFKSQWQEVQDKYSGEIGQFGRGVGKYGGQGKAPELSGFLDEYFGRGGGGERDWWAMSPRQRGTQDTRFNPMVQWNVNGAPRY